MARSRSAGARWEFGLFLPNLDIKTTERSAGFRSEFLGLFPDDAPEVRNARGPRADVGKWMLRRFKNFRGDRVRPSVLMIREDAPATIKSGDAMRSFRNIAALATVPYQRAMRTTGFYSPGPFVTDTFLFDYHVPNEGHIGTLDGPIVGFSSADKFLGRRDPRLRTEQRCQPEPTLFELLVRAWWRYYGRRRQVVRLRRLFRSLDVAFEAGRYPGDGVSSISDAGSRISLWVSAFEILVHDGKRADLPAVLNHISQVSWGTPALKAKKYIVRVRGQRVRASLPERIYSAIYLARNAYLHGNEVTVTSHWYRSRAHPELAAFAHWLYYGSLRQYVDSLGFRSRDAMFVDGLGGLGRISEAIAVGHAGIKP